MGTKSNPGKFDCYNAAHPDEPLFTLLGRDRLAPHLVMIWALIRGGEPDEAKHVFRDMLSKYAVHYASEPDTDKAKEAAECAHAMADWREAIGRP